MKTLLLVIVCSLALASCSKKDRPIPAKTLGEQLVGTGWWPVDSHIWTLVFAKDSASYVSTSTTFTYPYTVSNDTLTFYTDSVRTLYRISLSDHILTTTNIPFDGRAGQFQQAGFF